jgi:hypothetical protein
MSHTLGKGKGKPVKPPVGILNVVGSLGSEPFQDNGEETYIITGRNFAPNRTLWYNLGNPGCCLASYIITDSTGTFDFNRLTGIPGTYTFRLYDYISMTFLTGISFVVE